MNDKLLHTPEGVRDVYNGECLRKISLEQRSMKLFQSYGYMPIQTPTFEFFDVFGSDVGTTPSRELYKFFDREGNTLVMRPDFTPSIARAVAKYFTEEPVVRLCYDGNVFINNHSYQGRLKESTQLGAELIGEASVEADGEIISMVVRSLQEAGLKEFQISIGHVDIFQGLVEAAALEEEEIQRLQKLIMNKNFYGVQECLEELKVPKNIKEMFQALEKMYDGPADWKGWMALVAPYKKVRDAIAYLEELYQVLEIYEVEQYVSFEFGLLTTHQYYTGIIFSGYTFGSGEPVVKGGRYDDLMQYFKKSAPAIGFAIELDQLLLALDRQGLAEPISNQQIRVYYTKEKRNEAISYASMLRTQGGIVILYSITEDMLSKKEMLPEGSDTNRVKIFQ